MMTRIRFRDSGTGVLLVVIAAVAFSAKAIFVKLAYRYGVDAVTLLMLRMAFALPFFMVVAWRAEMRADVRLGRGQIAAVVGLGLIGYYLAALFDFIGLQYISAGLERLILFAYPTLTVIFAMLMFGQRPARRVPLALLLSYAGIALAVMHEVRLSEGHVMLGTALVFASAVAYALYLVGSGHMIGQLGTVRFTAHAMVVSALAVIVQFLLTRDAGLLVQPLPVYALGLAMAVVSTVLPAFLMSAGIRRIGSGSAAMAASVGPVSTIVLAALVLGEPMTSLQLAGLVLVLAGVSLIGMGRSRQAGHGR
ncbi:MAG TPA: DMT family transporter [Mariprofundaceae bacterium]|nr:DMT family transporter [Mariprofundaceae bacterium]